MNRTQERQHYDELDGYRGVAALLIVLLHTYQKPGVRIDRTSAFGEYADLLLQSLDIAVDWFFVLSGFLLFLPYARAALTQRSPVRVRSYLRRRILRLVPAYYAALLFFWLVHDRHHPDGWRNLIEHLTFTHIFDSRYMFSIVGPAWSLANEMIYALLLAGFGPLCYRICRHAPSPRLRLAISGGLVTSLCGISLAYNLYLLGWGHVALNNLPQHFQPLARFSTFGFGMLLALGVASNGVLLAGRTALLVRLLGGALTILTFLLPTLGRAGALFFPAFSGAAFALILGSSLLADRRSRWAQMFGATPLKLLGLISYGVYLWHEPILLALIERQWLIRSVPDAILPNIVIMFAIAIVLGAMSYRIIERPALALAYTTSRANWPRPWRNLAGYLRHARHTPPTGDPTAVEQG